MSTHAMWKMIHLLHVYGPTITRGALRKAGITCDPDTIGPLVASGVVEAEPPGSRWHTAKAFRLSQPTLGVLQNCLLIDRRDVWEHMYVDRPSVFVIMPFGEKWSKAVFTKMFSPAIKSVGLACVRGDTILRTGNLASNLIRELLSCGFVLADVTVPNPNVYFEVGFAQALGKTPLLFKQKGAALPADLAGAHYYDYSVDNLNAGMKQLMAALKKLVKAHHVEQVKALAK
jgi:hypothetical protein